MTALKDKVQEALSEARILILGTQVFLGFGFRAFFEEGFTRLPTASQHLKLGQMGVLLVAFALLVLPGAWHRIVHGGEDSAGFHRLVTRLMAPVLLLVAVTLGLDLFIAGEKVLGRGGGLALGVGGGLVAAVLLYGLEWVLRRRHAPERQRRQQMSGQQEEQSEGGTPLKSKIGHVLTETRVILPGAQALLGFQFATILVSAFDALPASSKLVHLGALGLMALSVVLLMTPAAYHRIVEQGEETERFQRFAGRMVLLATVPLALGLAGDLFVVVRKVLGSVPWALAAAGACLVLCYGLWFGLTLAHRAKKRAPRPPLARAHRPAHAR